MEKKRNYYDEIRMKINTFRKQNNGRKPKFLIIDAEKLTDIYDIEEYIPDFKLAKRGMGSHIAGLMICLVEYRTDEIFEVA